ncbi:MAG: tape measure protein [Anaerolineales bacterium]|nr:tape measure protein [Anaerolineales bacterium]
MALQVRDIFVSLGFDVDEKSLNDLDRSLVNIQKSVKSMTILFGGASLAIGGLLKVAGDFEQVEVAFETMLGSADKAKDLLEDITKFARTTPFSLTGIVDSSKQLLAFGIEQEKIIGTMTSLGNIAAGVGRDKLPTLVRAFGKIRTKGKATMEELNMLLEAGVPVLDELAKNYGVTTAELFKMISAGKVGFTDVEAALTGLSTGSGKFANLMEKQSKTFLGMLSNLKDFITVTAIEIGKELLPQAKALATQILNIFEANRKLIKGRFVKFFKSVASAMGLIFKAGIAVAEGIINITDAFGGLGEVIKGVVIAMLAFTGIQILSAIGSITTGIFGLVGAMKTLGTAALFTQAKMLVMPILIGAAVVALGLIIEDIIGFFRGKDSITGLIVEGFEKKFPEAFLTTKAALFAIKETVGIVIDEFKLLFGFIADVNAKATEALGKFARFIGLEGVAGFLGVGPETSPATAPANTTNAQTNQIKVDAPITVTVPEGTPASLVGTSISDGIKEAMGDMLRQASRATEPVTEF